MNIEKFENPIFEQSNATILTFNSDLTSEDCDKLRGLLMSSIENANHLVINFERAINVDLTCLQLLCMAKRISRRLKKFMILTGKFTIDKRELSSNSCNFFLDCSFSNNNSCILSELFKEHGLNFKYA